MFLRVRILLHTLTTCLWYLELKNLLLNRFLATNEDKIDHSALSKSKQDTEAVNESLPLIPSLPVVQYIYWLNNKQKENSIMIRRRCQHEGLMANHSKHTQHDLNSTIHTMAWQCSSLSSLLCWRAAASHTTHTCPALPLTSSSCLLVSSSILRMSSIVRSTHLSSQQKSCRWKFVKSRFSCCKWNKTQTSLVTGQLPQSPQHCNNFQRCVHWRSAPSPTFPSSCHNWKLEIANFYSFIRISNLEPSIPREIPFTPKPRQQSAHCTEGIGEFALTVLLWLSKVLWVGFT